MRFYFIFTFFKLCNLFILLFCATIVVFLRKQKHANRKGLPRGDFHCVLKFSFFKNRRVSFVFLYDDNRFPLAHVSQPHTVSAFDPPLINDCIIILFIVVANPPNRFIIISVFPPPFHFELRVFVSLVFWFSFGRRRIFLIFSRKCWFLFVCVCAIAARARV